MRVYEHLFFRKWYVSIFERTVLKKTRYKKRVAGHAGVGVGRKDQLAACMYVHRHCRLKVNILHNSKYKIRLAGHACMHAAVD